MKHEELYSLNNFAIWKKRTTKKKGLNYSSSYNNSEDHTSQTSNSATDPIIPSFISPHRWQPLDLFVWSASENPTCFFFESWENNRKRLQNKNGDHKKQRTPSLPTFLNGEKNHQIGSSGTRDGGQLTQHQGDFQDLIFIWSHVTCSSKIHGKCTSKLLQ